MTSTFPLQVLRITETVFSGDVTSVTAPGSAGELTILANHETMLTSLKKGELCVRKIDGEELDIPVEHGFVEATKDKVVILL